MKHFILEDFLTDLEAKLSIIDIDSNSTNVNDDVKNFATFKEILDRHAPLRPKTRSEKRLSDKPWITKHMELAEWLVYWAPKLASRVRCSTRSSL